MNWLLPEYLADALPAEAASIEGLRRVLLDLFRSYGYELVSPPLLEHLDSLLTGSGQDLRLLTFKLVDQLSGRTLGIRADMTPQVARIDAHLLNRQGVTRLCYCGSVLHTLPASLAANRELLQLGVELYGHAGVAADREVIRLLAEALARGGAPAARIDLGHVGVLRALLGAAAINDEQAGALLPLLQGKDVPGLRALCHDIAEPFRSALLGLPELYGGVDTLARAASMLPPLPGIVAALATLRALRELLPDLPLTFDLADLRGYHYHNGVVFAAYHPAFPGALARGGRYDGVGRAFGRERPATGFSLDLRELARQAVRGEPERTAILAPHVASDATLAKAIATLRAAGEIVIELLPGEGGSEGPLPNRQLVYADGQWQLRPMPERNGTG